MCFSVPVNPRAHSGKHIVGLHCMVPFEERAVRGPPHIVVPPILSSLPFLPPPSRYYASVEDAAHNLLWCHAQCVSYCKIWKFSHIQLQQPFRALVEVSHTSN